MISWIVASHQPDVLADNLLATLTIADGDELVVVENPTSIALAYAEGQARATKSIRCYIHHDVQILRLADLRRGLMHTCPGAGIVGVVGSRDRRVPWWDGRKCGSVVDARMGLLHFGPGGPCSYLDGLLLATERDVDWDTSYPGFHLYDHDSCEQMLRGGFENRCLDDGHLLIRHNTAGSSNTAALTHWDSNVERFREKWGD